MSNEANQATKDEQALAEETYNRELAAVLVKKGGRCRVGSGFLFDVTMQDGRVFRGCGIHGAGGRLASMRSIRAVLLDLASFDGTIRIYLTDTWVGSECIKVPYVDVVSVVKFWP